MLLSCIKPRKGWNDVIKTWYSNGEILLPIIQGLSAMWFIGIIRRAMDWPLGVDMIGILSALVGGWVAVYRFFAKRND